MNIYDIYLIKKAIESSNVCYVNTSANNFGYLSTEKNERYINKNIIYATTEKKLKSFLSEYISQIVHIQKGYILPYAKSSKRLTIFFVCLDDIRELISEDKISDIKNTNFEQYQEYRNNMIEQCLHYLKYDLEREPSANYYKIDITNNIVNFMLIDKTKYNQQKEYLKKNILSMIIESFDKTLKYDLIANKIKIKSRVLLDYHVSHISFDDLYEIPII